MPRAHVPGPIEKRDLLYPKAGTEIDHAGFVEACVAAERYEDAMDFVDRADRPDPSWIKPIHRYAVSHGDAHLLLRIDRAFRDLLTAEDWKEAAGRASLAGKEFFAKQCRAKAGIPEPAAAPVPPAPTTPEAKSGEHGHEHPHGHA
ncbi:MAG: hypothetical protein HYY93_12985 [Planctomycetes bacterium]|nr:hypothetical protein [Planctomycetota bacterium]